MIEYGFGKTLFGSTFIAMEKGKLLRLSFVPKGQLSQELKKLAKQRPGSEMTEQSPRWSQAQLKSLLPTHFQDRKRTPAPLKLEGTPFQIKVWKALIDIPFGKTSTYSEIAKQIGSPKAVRAVGSAVGANPIGYLVPCHRVLPKAGGIGQFGWGPELKKKMLKFEKAI